MAGGRNTRFGGAIKALAEVNGEQIIVRVRNALAATSAIEAVVLIANNPGAFEGVTLQSKVDLFPDIGPLGGLYTALDWAYGRGDQGILVVACDMPFPSVGLLQEIADAAREHDAVIPESDSRRGLEPLFAYYSVACLPPIAAAIKRKDYRMISFHDEIGVFRLPLERVQTHGEPGILFMNVNTAEDLLRARGIAGEQQS